MKRARLAFLIICFTVLAWPPKALVAGTLPNISGTWYASGDPSRPCSISQSGTSVTVTNEQGATANGNFVNGNPSRIDTDWGPLAGGHIYGNISNDLQRIDWSNGTYWIRAAGSGGNPATPQPTPAPERLNVSSHVEGNESSPIYIYAASLSNGEGRSYQQCVSFRNVSNKEATDVDFSFVVTRYSGAVDADFGYVDRGKFTPPVAIDDHCWTGALWPNRVVRMMATETVRVKAVTFADGTYWKPGMPFVRAYGNGGAPLPQR